MKNRNTYRLVPLLIFSTILLWPFFPGCKKESPPPEVKQELEPKVELTVTPEGVIPYGGSVDIRWTADNNTNKVVLVVNGIVKETRYGSNSRQVAFYVDHLFKDALISVVATNVDLSTEVEKEVHVGDWTTSAFGLVSYYPWRYKEFRVSSVNGVIMSTIYLTEEELSWIMYYHRDGRYTVSNLSKVQYWSIPNNDSTIVVNGTSFKLKVNQEEMIISYEVTYNGQPAWFDMVLVHASDTPTDPG